MSTPKINEIHDEAEVERVARAICANSDPCRYGGCTPDDIVECLTGFMPRWKMHTDNARAALSAIDVAGIRADKWMPIETAPHDEVVLLYWKDWADREYMEAARASHGQSYPNGYSDMSRHGSATHWQPLPLPPALSPQES